ncbi:hypothetical protein COLO4_35965 [Corchorus olitorius]|uniref:Uncharacterized protein n=1 Tax=Corchorus olitorius TaxID=93759 RepID=A0A1R3GBP2_9ROSI|nr:hypothetical protein COLO4_35965 [Corchorus olitorius]
MDIHHVAEAIFWIFKVVLVISRRGLLFCKNSTGCREFDIKSSFSKVSGKSNRVFEEVTL